MQMQCLYFLRREDAHKKLEMRSNIELGNLEMIQRANNSTRTKAAAISMSISCSHWSYIMKPLNAHTRPALLKPIAKNFFFLVPVHWLFKSLFQIATSYFFIYILSQLVYIFLLVLSINFIFVFLIFFLIVLLYF